MREVADQAGAGIVKGARPHNLVFLLAALCAPVSLSAQTQETPAELKTAREDYAKAQTELADASAAQSAAEVARMRLERSVQTEYLNRSDLLELKRYAAAATLHYNALRNAVLNELATDPDYQQLKQRAQDAVAALAEAKSKPETAMAEEIPLARAVMDARKAISAYEGASMALDPAIDDARVEMNRAHEAARKLELTYRRLAVNDERLAQASAEVKHTRERVEKARSELDAAAQKLAEAEKREQLRAAARHAHPPPIDRPER